jgi:hypothetical protein
MARIIVPAIDKVAAKWIRRAGSAGEEYRVGVSESRADWAGSTAAAAQSYAAGVQEAIASGRFGKGVAAAGNAKWKRMSEEKGAVRFGPGVQAGEADFGKGFAPYLAAIGAVDLPMPGPRGAEGNFQRSQLVGRALNQLRVKK